MIIFLCLQGITGFIMSGAHRLVLVCTHCQGATLMTPCRPVWPPDRPCGRVRRRVRHLPQFRWGGTRDQLGPAGIQAVANSRARATLCVTTFPWLSLS